MAKATKAKTKAKKPKPATVPAEVGPQPGKQESGAAKMRASGRRGIMLAVTPEQYARLKSAADADLRALSAWILVTALKSAPEL